MALIEQVLDVDVVIPTLNAARVLRKCLDSISGQQLTNLRLKVFVVDAGSTDESRAIAEEYGARLLDNPLRTAEAGKFIGLRAAAGDVVAFIDSDNVLVGERWFEQMVAPFAEPDIAATEPLRYVVRRSDGYLTRYFAYLGMGDPLSLFLGNYDRFSVLTGRWTDMRVRTVSKPGYEKVWLDPGQVPTMGANGFMVRRRVLHDLSVGDYLFDVDLVDRLLEQRRWAFAKVRCGIVHLFAGDVRTFRRKQRRRIRDFLHYQENGLRTGNPVGRHRWGLLRFIVATLLGWPLVWQTFQGVRRTRDAAWLFHPAACALTLFEYACGVLGRRWRPGPLGRDGWGQ